LAACLGLTAAEYGGKFWYEVCFNSLVGGNCRQYGLGSKIAIVPIFGGKVCAFLGRFGLLVEFQWFDLS